MPVLTAPAISALAVELLQRTLVLPATISRVGDADYDGTGGTVTVRVPRPRSARVQATPGATITFDNLDEVGVEVVVNHLYDATLVTDEDLSLAIVDFGRQVLRPQVAAIAEGAENQVAAVMNALDVDHNIAFAASATPDDTKGVVLAIREELTRRNIPAAGRWLAVAPDIATRILKVPTFVEADKRGSTNALESAVIGTVYGLSVVEAAGLHAGTAVAYHSSGFCWANFAPRTTAAMNAAVTNEQGVALRTALPFIGDRLSSASVVSTFAGAAPVLDGGPVVTLTTSAAADDIIDTATPHGFVAGDRVQFLTLTGGTGLSSGTDYYVIAANLGAQTFKVAATPGGSAIDFSANITAGTVEAVGARERSIRIGTAS